MPSHHSIGRRALRAAVALLSAGSLGCFAVSRGSTDWDDRPVTNTGVGASIIYPNQSAPTYYPPGTQPAPQQQPQPGVPGSTPKAPGGGAPQQANPSYGSAPTVTVGPYGEQRSGGNVAPNSIPITMIGGAEQDISGHRSWKQEPLWLKYLMLPFAVVAAPFKAAIDHPEPGPALPRSQPLPLGTEAPRAAPPPPPATDYETALVDELERELDARNQRNATPTANPRATAAPQASASQHGNGAHSPSIAEELAALQRRSPHTPQAVYTPPPESTLPATTHAPGLSARTESPRRTVAQPRQPQSTADGIVDRDGNGRVDQWIFRDRGRISRIELDENADGLPDRTIHYDLETSKISRVEEDANGDGATDSWTDYANGLVLRRRGDGNADGQVDTWTFYRDGVITRHEQDTDGDGFRDRVGYYSNGKITREEKDNDGDGRPDAVLYYDALERISRREEDRDQDGRPDVISHYVGGKLSRKELIQNDDMNEDSRP